MADNIIVVKYRSNKHSSQEVTSKELLGTNNKRIYEEEITKKNFKKLNTKLVLNSEELINATVLKYKLTVSYTTSSDRRSLQVRLKKHAQHSKMFVNNQGQRSKLQRHIKNCKIVRIVYINFEYYTYMQELRYQRVSLQQQQGVKKFLKASG